MAREAAQREKEKAEREKSQVTLDYVKDPFSSPSAKQQSIAESAAAKGITDNLRLMSTIKVDDPRFVGAKMAIAKEIIIAYGLGVSEGVLNEVGGMVANGASVQDFATILKEHGGVADKLASAMALVLSNMSGTKDLNTISTLARGAQENARKKVEILGITDRRKFEEDFPVYGEMPTPPADNGKKSAADTLKDKGIGKTKQPSARDRASKKGR